MSFILPDGDAITVVVNETTGITVIVPDGPTPVILTEPQTETKVIAMAIPGPDGPTGPQGPAGGETLVEVGPSPISGHSAVACNPSGNLIAADCTQISHLGAVLGVVVNAYSPGALAEVKTGFPLVHTGWTWAPGPVYVGTAGQLTQTLPPGALFCQVVGHALSATRVLVDLQPPILIS